DGLVGLHVACEPRESRFEADRMGGRRPDVVIAREDDVRLEEMGDLARFLCPVERYKKPAELYLLEQHLHSCEGDAGCGARLVRCKERMALALCPKHVREGKRWRRFPCHGVA